MLLVGTLCMGFFMFLVGGIQGRFGHWVPQHDHAPVWIIENNAAAGNAVIVTSYLFICSYAVAMGPVVWTYPAEIVSRPLSQHVNRLIQCSILSVVLSKDSWKSCIASYSASHQKT